MYQPDNFNIMLSIIVPIYNTEDFLRRCVDSILMNCETSFELILVNDGSTDGCAKIVDEYAANDSRVKALHKGNGGSSSARNAGLDVSLGEYIGFIDSDDYVSLSYIPEFFRAIKLFRPDIIIGGRYTDNNGTVSTEFNMTPGKISKIEVINRILIWDNLDGSVCDKIFRKELFNEINFKLGVYAEDLPVTIKVLQKADSIYHVGKEVYFYYKRKGSVTSNFFSDKMISVLDSISDVHKNIDKDTIDQKKLDFFIIWHLSRFYIRYFSLSKLNRAELKKNMNSFLPRVSQFRIWSNHYLLWRDKLLMSFVKVIN